MRCIVSEASHPISSVAKIRVSKNFLHEGAHIVETTIVGISLNGTTSKISRVVNQAVGLKKIKTLPVSS